MPSPATNCDKRPSEEHPSTPPSPPRLKRVDGKDFCPYPESTMNILDGSLKIPSPVKEALSGVDSPKPTSQEVVYEMNREAKELYKREMKLTNCKYCKFVNLINMSMRLKKIDKLERIQSGDKTTDLLGSVREIGIVKRQPYKKANGEELALYVDSRWKDN